MDDYLSHKILHYGNSARNIFYDRNEMREIISSQLFKEVKIETRQVPYNESKDLVLEHIAAKFPLTFSSGMFSISQYFYC